MIQKNTILNVIDNSGAKTVSCIKVGKGFNCRYATIGDVIIVSVKTLRKKRRISCNVVKGDICKALILRTKITKNFLISSENIFFFENSVVLLNKNNKYLFSRIFGSIPQHIRYTKYMRLISLSSGLNF